MPKSPRPKALREPVQVYLAPDDRELLNRLAAESGLSKAEILRRGVRSFAREQGGESPMLRFIGEGGTGGWPASGVAGNHDAELAESYRDTGKGTAAMRRKRR